MKNFNLFSKKHFRFMAVLCLLIVLATSKAWAVDPVATLTFTKACGGSGTDSEGNSWTIASDASESTYSSTQGIHYGTNDIAVDHVNISTTAITSTVSQVVVEASRGGNNVSLSVSVGSTSFKCGGNTSVALTTTNTSYTFTGSASGTILVHLYKPGGSATKKAIYCKSVAVTHAAGSTKTLVFADNLSPHLCLFIEPQESHKANFGVASD